MPAVGVVVRLEATLKGYFWSFCRLSSCPARGLWINLLYGVFRCLWLMSSTVEWLHQELHARWTRELATLGFAAEPPSIEPERQRGEVGASYTQLPISHLLQPSDVVTGD